MGTFPLTALFLANTRRRTSCNDIASAGTVANNAVVVGRLVLVLAITGPEMNFFR